MQDPDYSYGHSFFHRIALRDLSGEQKSGVASTIIDDINTNSGYRGQMMLAAVIASLGLMINAAPVVIGAMLIAPIMRPIQAVSFATATGNRTLFFRSLGLLLLSIFFSIIAAICITAIIPFSQVTNEILIRTQPTLVDLGIAFASGCIAFLTFKFEKLEASLAGVAMAASLVPPICVIGIGIGFMQRSIAWGSFILVLTNLVAIIFAGIILFYMYGFYPTHKRDLKHSLINSVSILVILLILCIPLATSMIRISEDITTQSMIQNTLTSSLQSLNKNITVETFSYDKNTILQDETRGTSIAATIRIPQQIPLTNEQKISISRNLSEVLQTSVDLTLNLIPIASVTFEEEQPKTLEERLRLSTQTFLEDYPGIYLLRFDLVTNQKSIVVASFYSDKSINRVMFKEDYLQFLQGKDSNIGSTIINREIDETATEEIDEETDVQVVADSFRNFFFESQLRKISLNQFPDDEKVYATLRISTPLSSSALSQKMENRKAILETLVDQEISITLHITNEEVVEY